MTKTYARNLAWMIICVAAVACAQPRPTYESSWQRLLTHFSGCSSEHGYDPRSQAELPQNRLGKGELKWRACAYQGVENIMIPNAAAPGLFRQLIREDKAMTAKIASGEMTRSERKARVTAVLDDLRRREDASRDAEYQRLEYLRAEQRDLYRSHGRALREARRTVRGRF